MALTLVEAAKLMQDDVQAGVIFNTYLANPLVGLLPFENIPGSAYVYTRAPGVGTVSNTRAINADYTEETVGFTRLTASLGRLGGKAQVDNFLQVTGSDINDQLAAQIAAKSKYTGIAFQNQFFNGDVATDANGFDGLKKLLTGTSQETLDALTMITLADIDSLLLSLDSDASALFMNDKTLLKINALAKGSGMLAFNSIETVGTRISTYGGVPIYRAGKLGTNASILADGEVYAVRFGVDGVHGIQASTPEAKLISPDQNASAPVWTARIDWYAGIAQKALQSAARVTKKIV
ncbi:MULTISPECIES: major capsid protein [Deinococcus]|uniref:Major capsid protein n=1 Tax=Deinococcus rufus TaxID=2136097 RepID=A0ABV7Z8P6_9DEIO|nr:phage major capsid protein [Deinococcus sp. AB2017081]WQE94427.1 hypothetical protein U2P90_13560 [Deinococcus sp. AB2017081]